MANKHRGEIDAEFDGTTMRLCLTLGALAELEAAFGDEDMLQLAARFENGRLRSVDAIRIIGAGLRGAGADVTNDEVAKMQCQGGAAGFVGIVADLLRATFGGDGTDVDGSAVAATEHDMRGAAGTGGEAHPAVPFRGATSPNSALPHSA